jgi:hypothetical protein
MEISPLSLYFLMEYNEAPRTPRRSLHAANARWATALEGVSIGRTAVGTPHLSSMNTVVYLTNLA